MYIEKFSAKGFRNLTDVEIVPSRHLNIITGLNAQGKTNLIEAIYVMTGCKSFRNVKENDYVNLELPTAEVHLQFNDGKRSQNIDCNLKRSRGKDKAFKLNGVPLKGTSSLFENFKCIVFMPDDIELIKGSPEKRRSFIDLCYCQISPSAVGKLRRLELVTSHRNALLKSIAMNRADVSALVPWDAQLAELGAYISHLRFMYTQMLSKKATELYYEVSGNTENLVVEYQSNVFTAQDFERGYTEELPKKYLQALKRHIDDDLRAGYTLYGTSRDDITLKIDKLPVKSFGSQGQKKSTAIVLKLAQADIFSKKTHETPVVLLDDVMAELDPKRQKYICSMLKDTQVFITVCNQEVLVERERAKVFFVEDGKVTSM
jgi:DNA replication and repair protein RecF